MGDKRNIKFLARQLLVMFNKAQSLGATLKPETAQEAGTSLFFGAAINVRPDTFLSLETLDNSPSPCVIWSPLYPIGRTLKQTLINKKWRDPTIL